MTECEYYQQLISQRLDGELTAAQEHELAEHLSRCADCRAVDAAFRALSEGFADSAEDAPADLCENVMGEIRRENIRKTNKRGSKRTWRSLLATAACFALICAAAATALPMLARSSASTAAAQSADTANETDGSGADAAMPADAAPAEEPESAAEQRAKADGSMLYTMESASEAGAASYNVSADELGRFVEMLSDGASESAMPEAAADESCVVGSEYNNVCVYIYGGRVLYSTDGGETVYESAVSAEGVNEILAFFAG